VSTFTGKYATRIYLLRDKIGGSEEAARNSLHQLTPSTRFLSFFLLFR